MKVCLFDLAGGGDHDMFFTDLEIYEWVIKNDMPINYNWEKNGYTWLDPNTPEIIRSTQLGYFAVNITTNPKGLAELSSGSFENDRAILAERAALLFEGSYGSLADMINIAKNEGWEIAESYSGVMY